MSSTCSEIKGQERYNDTVWYNNFKHSPRHINIEVPELTIDDLKVVNTMHISIILVEQLKHSYFFTYIYYYIRHSNLLIHLCLHAVIANLTYSFLTEIHIYNHKHKSFSSILLASYQLIHPTWNNGIKYSVRHSRLQYIATCVRQEFLPRSAHTMYFFIKSIMIY